MNKEFFVNLAKTLLEFIEIIAVVSIATIFVVCITKSCNNISSKSSSPIEEIKIDSAIKENDKLILEINNIDSIKNVEILEVKTLDNDSTLKLFYKLIRK